MISRISLTDPWERICVIPQSCGKIMGAKDEGQLSCYKYQGLTSSLLSTDTNCTMETHESSNCSRIAQTHTVNANNADDKYVLTHICTLTRCT
jgi:hypothetical protein